MSPSLCSVDRDNAMFDEIMNKRRLSCANCGGGSSRFTLSTPRTSSSTASALSSASPVFNVRLRRLKCFTPRMGLVHFGWESVFLAARTSLGISVPRYSGPLSIKCWRAKAKSDFIATNAAQIDPAEVPATPEILIIWSCSAFWNASAIGSIATSLAPPPWKASCIVDTYLTPPYYQKHRNQRKPSKMYGVEGVTH